MRTNKEQGPPLRWPLIAGFVGMAVVTALLMALMLWALRG